MSRLDQPPTHGVFWVVEKISQKNVCWMLLSGFVLASSLLSTKKLSCSRVLVGKKQLEKY